MADEIKPARLDLEPDVKAVATEDDAVPAAAHEAPAGYGYGYGYGYGGEAMGGHAVDYLKVIYKRRWTAMTVFSVTMLLVVSYTFTRTPIYESRVRLLIEPDTPNFVNYAEVLDEGQGRTDFFQTQYSLLRTRSLARRTLETLDLFKHPDFGGPTDEEPSFSLSGTISKATSAVGSLLSNVVSSAETDTELEAAILGETASESAAIDILLGGLGITPVRNSRIVDVTFRSSDPLLATEIAREQGRGFIQQNLEFRFRSSLDATDWLAERLSDARMNVEEAEQSLQRYREEQDVVALEGSESTIVQNLGELNTAVTRARTSRIGHEALYDQLTLIKDDPAALDSFPAILSNAFIQQMKVELARLEREAANLNETLGERHPEMIRSRAAVRLGEQELQSEIAKVVQSVRNDFLTAQQQEDSLQSALDEQRQEAQSMNRASIEYGVLRREAESVRQIYESLLQRSQETGIAGELRTSNVRVVDEAEVPRYPVLPRSRRNVLIALFGGMMLAVGFVYFFEYLDDRIKNPDEIKNGLGLAFFGMIPRLSGTEFKRKAPLLAHGAPGDFAEAVRALRTNVLFSTTEQGVRVVVVTSAAPGEGKTLVSTNLAVALALAHESVLLVDADMRRPDVHKRLGGKLEPGLSNLLTGGVTVKEAIRKTNIPKLWIIPGGKIPPDPSELLGSARFRSFIEALESHFTWVIIDTPPVLPVTDAVLVAKIATSVLFVIRSEKSKSRDIKVALERLDQAKAPPVGAVLNYVDFTRNSYYYSQYYRSGYSSYQNTS